MSPVHDLAEGPGMADAELGFGQGRESRTPIPKNLINQWSRQHALIIKLSLQVLAIWANKPASRLFNQKPPFGETTLI